MKISSKVVDDVLIVVLEGKLSLGTYPILAKIEGLDPSEVDTPALDLTNFLKRVVSLDWRKIVLDLGGVPLMDSSGLGVLAQFHAICVHAEPRIKFVLARPSSKVAEYLEITHVNTVFTSFATVEAAVASFSGSMSGGEGPNPDGFGTHGY